MPFICVSHFAINDYLLTYLGLVQCGNCASIKKVKYSNSSTLICLQTPNFGVRVKCDVNCLLLHLIKNYNQLDIEEQECA